MRRKLVKEDLIKVKKLLNQLHISDERVTFNLAMPMVESGEDSLATSEHNELSLAEVDLQLEEEVINQIINKSAVPLQKGLQYIQSCYDYLETEREQIIFSAYNVKLLQTVDKLFSGGMDLEQVRKGLEEGEAFFSAPYAPASELAGNFFDSVEKPFLGTEEEEEDEERRKGARARKSFKLVLGALLLLLLFGAGSYQLGLLQPFGFYPSSRGLPEKVLIPEPAGKEKNGDEGQTPAKEELNIEIIPTMLPAEITVAVLNGSGRSGLAGRFADVVRKAGYQVVLVDNADNFNYKGCQIINRLEGDEAWELLTLIPGAEIITEAAGGDKAMLTIILGADYVERAW